MKSLLVFTFGPVQSFLTQARKTHDLYGGSRLLSYLCELAAEEAGNYGAEIIYPDLQSSSLPNRFVALMPQDPEEVGTIAGGIATTIREKVCSLGEAVLRVCCTQHTPDLRTLFSRQLAALFEVHWAAAPYEGGKYPEAYRHVEEYLEAMKVTRRFSSLDEKGRKCSLTGEHNALFYRTARRAYLCPEALRVPDSLPLRYLAEGECLGGVGMVKRCVDVALPQEVTHTGYPSTAAIALLETLARLSSEEVDNYRRIFGEHFDDHFFYEESLTPAVLSRGRIPLGKLETARVSLRQLQDEAAGIGARFTRYYAVVYGDGDNMGKWVSGLFLADPATLLDFQRRLTQKLGEYSRYVGEYLKPPKGHLVYCGGDDVLGLVNINHLIPVLEELRKRFPAYEDLAGVNGGQTSSSSCGVCIAHYKAPLSEVLNWARMTEETAKETGGKDAFALAVLKHSGEIHQTSYKWDYAGLRPLLLLQELVDLLARKEFSATFIRNLSREFRYLKPPSVLTPSESAAFGSASFASEEEMVREEIGRLLKRACQGDSKDLEEIIPDLKEKLTALYTQGSLGNFLSFLEIAAFVEREVNAKPCSQVLSH